jgi:hemolysin D
MLVPLSNGPSPTQSVLSTPSNSTSSKIEEAPTTVVAPSTPESQPTRKAQPFDRPVILQRSPIWSRVIIWSIVASVAGVLTWANLFKFDEAIPATGQLEPQGAVKEVQTPVVGVVKEIKVRDGQKVKKGDVLLRLDPQGTRSELGSLQKVRESLLAEQGFYRQQTQHAPGLFQSPVFSAQVPAQMRSLADSRQALISETQLYRAQLRGSGVGVALTLEQRMRLRSSLQEASSRSGAARLESEQLKKQLEQAQIQYDSAVKTREVNQKLVEDLMPVVASGGIARVELIKQQEALQKAQADMERLKQEEERLRLAIAQADQKVDNTVSVSQKDLLATIANNEKQIAEIDSQFAKVLVENEKQIAEVDNKLAQANLTLKYQELRAPTDGVVFDLKAHAPGFVANPREPILKIVPADNLVAKVYITNRDIGFIRTGMAVDVRVDSFPFSEFGDIKGKLVWIGSDALPPTQTRQFYSFPAKVQLNSQMLMAHQRKLALQSGMSLNVNIKTRQRTVMSIFTDLFTGQTENLKHLR